MGAGGNITIFESKDGLLVVDAGLPDTSEAVLGKMKALSGVPVKTLINTHWHNDHTGGNPAFGKSGALIVAHVNTLKRVSVKQHMVFFNRDVEPLAAEGLPKKTFSTQDEMSFGGETIHVAYHPPAHTDGDSTVHFANANILSTGDLMFSGMYPFIDYSSGGSIEGMIHNAAALLKMVDDQTKIVPGHGPLATKMELADFHNMLASVNETVSALVKQGKSVGEAVEVAPTKKYDAKFGSGFLKPADFVKMLYQGKTELAAKAAA
jgi:glyoxylase-like metal-dependent hydrolase (beta-lactamase superfamily II)